MPTPEPHVIENNIDDFVKRWEEALQKDNQEKSLREIENIRSHVKKGCVSGINPGQGMECSECLHQTVNKLLLCGATTIGPEIAIAVLSLIFYGINCKKQKNPIHLDNVWNTSDIDKSNLDDIPTNNIIVAENVRDMCNDTISALLLKNTATLKETLEEINKQSNDRSFATYDLPVVQSVSAKPLLTTENISASDQTYVDLLERNLADFNLHIDPLKGDGDCVFRSIVKQLRNNSE